MSVFDLVVVGIVFLSLVFGFFRGFVRVVVALGTWIIAVVAAVRFSGNLGPMLPDFGESAATRYVLAFAVILIAILVLGAVIGWALARLVRAIGLGFVDRTLGAVVGIARGVVIVVVGVLLAGLTTLPRQVWWQNAVLAPPLVTAALSLRPWLPKPFADKLDFGLRERVPAKATTRV